jgi:RHH-type transcriptional regulator, proline utilization regulon repressor / proline dehydrogenase / delta 1-pyrroline-5-carboxylate dehydrogenase
VGSGAKAGGPNYVLQLGTWQQVGLPKQQAMPEPAVAALLARCLSMVQVEAEKELLRASAGSYAWAWQTHFSQEHDPSQIRGEANTFRYRPCPHILVRISAGADAAAVAQVVLAACTCGAGLTASLAPENSGWHWLHGVSQVHAVVEEEAGLVARLEQAGGYERLRAMGPLSTELRRAANRAGVNVIDEPVLANGRLELRHYLREQAVSQTTHRYGNLMEPSTRSAQTSDG